MVVPQQRPESKIGVIRDSYIKNHYLNSRPDTIAHWLDTLLENNSVYPEQVINIDISDMQRGANDYVLFTVFYHKVNDTAEVDGCFFEVIDLHSKLFLGYLATDHTVSTNVEQAQFFNKNNAVNTFEYLCNDFINSHKNYKVQTVSPAVMAERNRSLYVISYEFIYSNRKVYVTPAHAHGATIKSYEESNNRENAWKMDFASANRLALAIHNDRQGTLHNLTIGRAD